jgi:hypothetical protein
MSLESFLSSCWAEKPLLVLRRLPAAQSDAVVICKICIQPIFHPTCFE